MNAATTTTTTQQQLHYPIHLDVDYETGTTVVWRGPNHLGNFVTYDWYCVKRYYLVKGLEIKARDDWRTRWNNWEIWVSSWKGGHSVFKRWLGPDKPPITQLMTKEQFIAILSKKLEDDR